MGSYYLWNQLALFIPKINLKPPNMHKFSILQNYVNIVRTRLPPYKLFHPIIKEPQEYWENSENC